jgi:hypothetical protein
MTVGLLGAIVAFGSSAAVSTASGAGAAPGSKGLVVGFTIERKARVKKAAMVGIKDDILYGSRSPKLEQYLAAAGIGVIDGRISSDVSYWECHRTHTVTPPPEGDHPYCATDRKPGFDSPAAVLAAVETQVREDTADPLVHGYWVLDDWPAWDGGSATTLLQEIHAVIERLTPGYPAICGFGGTIGRFGQTERFDLSDAENFSPSACSMVGLYNYASWSKHPAEGSELDWRMQILLAEQTEALQENGWNVQETPLLGIGQAFSGPFGNEEIVPGLTAQEMREEAQAFCAAGATSLGWYAWGDSQFLKTTRGPYNSKIIRQGITESLSDCGL